MCSNGLHYIGKSKETVKTKEGKGGQTIETKGRILEKGEYIEIIKFVYRKEV